MLSDERLQHARVAVLRVAEVEDFIEQLVDQHEIVLDILFANFTEIRLHDLDHLVQELEDHGRVDVLLGHGAQPDIRPFRVEETRSRDVNHGKTRLLTSMNDVDAKGIDSITTNIVPIDTLEF